MDKCCFSEEIQDSIERDKAHLVGLWLERLRRATTLREKKNIIRRAMDESLLDLMPHVDSEDVPDLEYVYLT